MDCRMSRGIYLRANGKINCYCSTGEILTLGDVPDNSTRYDFVDDIYYNSQYTHIRDSFKNHKLPFPNQCMKCNYLDTNAVFPANKVDNEIEWAHIEAASICNLKCAYCLHGSSSPPKREKNSILSVPLYNKILDDIFAHGFNIKWMYFSGKGEPGLHPFLWDMVVRAKSKFDTNFLVNTNGNIDFNPAIVTSGLDKIKIALDSLDQETYARYRVKGNVDKVLQFTKQISEYKKQTHSKTPEIIWQKVLFNFNDSDEELIEYQKKALEYGVNTLRIVHTFTKNYSTRKKEDFPVIFPNIEFIWGSAVPKDLDSLKTTAFEKIDMEIKELEHHKSINGFIGVISKILHLYEQGFENRNSYDAYSSMPLDDSRLYTPLKNYYSHENYTSAIVRCYSGLSEQYQYRGENIEADRYASIAEKISRM